MPTPNGNITTSEIWNQPEPQEAPVEKKEEDQKEEE
jgi:hypothetical protein